MPVSSACHELTFNATSLHAFVGFGGYGLVDPQSRRYGDPPFASRKLGLMLADYDGVAFELGHFSILTIGFLSVG